MKTTLQLTLRREEAVLIRILGLVVRRGFEPVRFAAQLSPTAATLEVEMTVDGERSVDSLMRHLTNLYDVERIERSPA